MSDNMKAVVKRKPGLGAELDSVSKPTPRSNEVLVRVIATSICGTDVHIYRWDPWAEQHITEKNLPQVLGHEFCGMVEAVGSCVQNIKEGDYISAETHIPCNRCIQCRGGQQHLCHNLKIVGVDRDGCFAEYVVIPESVCWINDKKIPPEYASVQEPLGNAVYTVLGEDGDIAGKNMVILGDGPTGLLATGVARACGATQIFLVGLNEYTMEIGKRMGADHLLFAGSDSIDRVAYVRDNTYGYGADIVLEMSGAPQALSEGLQMVRKGGRFSAFGIMPEDKISFDYNQHTVFSGIQIHSINGRKMFDTWYRVRNLLSSGRLKIDPVVTHIILLSDFKKGFEEMMAMPRKSAKIVMFPHEEDYKEALSRRN